MVALYRLERRGAVLRRDFQRNPTIRCVARVLFLAGLSLGWTAVGCGDDSASGPWRPSKDGSVEGSLGDGSGADVRDETTGDTGVAEAGSCKPRTCAQVGAECGWIPDGCGGKVDCGATCKAGQLCGGGGPNKCGDNLCSLKSCMQMGASCGYASDGCSDVLDCGGCPPPTSCGAAGKENQCGCVPKSCAQLGASCGSAPDGCLGAVECGTCPTGQTCGGGGLNKCGTNSCMPKTCAKLQASCGYVSDGCGLAIQCGECLGKGEVCLSTSNSSYCTCPSKTCSQLGATCGSVLGNCGPLECGTCTAPDTCGGAGVANQCGCVCQAPQATTSCLAGACSIAKCDVGWSNCDADSSNGCEKNTSADSANCGDCGKTCALAQASASCKGAQCVLEACAQGYADCDKDPATSCEVNAQADPMHCGNCSIVCPAGGGTAICTAGVCGVSSCAAGTGDCDSNAGNGCESNLATSLQHCGFCNNPCAFPKAVAKCANSVCEIDHCEAGYGDCDGNKWTGCETATQSSTQHCGGCGKACQAGPHAVAACQNGSCTLVCNGGFGDCDSNLANGCETPLVNDEANCGACNKACTAAHGVAGCVAGQCAVSSCDPSWADCDGNGSNGCETNTSNDPIHCGGCNGLCSQVHGTASCASGVCALICEKGWSDCDGNVKTGCETHTASDVQNCGTCGNLCPSTGGTPACSAGICGTSSCDSTHGDCDGNPGNGCEVDLTTDSANCGGCGTACSAAQGTAACQNKVCVIADCNSGWQDCNGQYADGCEINTGSDIAHCGSCTTVCPSGNGTATCSSGACGINCNAGWGNCDNDAANGCEAYLQNDAQHCGSCSTVCNTPQATPACVSGTCAIGSCASGYSDCNAAVSDGCETNTGGDTAHCGNCTTACSTNHGTPSCSGGVCSLVCAPGWDNCDSQVGNGCETDLNSDVQNCATCGHACSTSGGTPACSSGVCGVAVCDPGRGDCDGSTANGCETNLNTDPAHCGSCPNACTAAHGSAGCNAGVCSVSGCDSGWGNCNGQYSDGCETNTTNNPSHCGACNSACSTNHGTPSCSSSNCGITCNGGWGNCDGSPGNGCETDLSNTAEHCGDCWASCSTNHINAACSSGDCTGNCDNGWDNCDGNKRSNGCERQLGTNDNCLSCNDTCSDHEGCQAGVGCRCGDSGLDCVGNDINYCCTNSPAGCYNVTNNAFHCGHSCILCGDHQGCEGSSCTCHADYGDCDSDPTNCETYLPNNSTHCGACGNSCGQNAYCGGSQCYCYSNWDNCNNDWNDGCEANLCDYQNCGSCNNYCGYWCENCSYCY